MDAETSGSDLDDGIFTITVKILVETAFAGIVKDSQFCGCQGKGFVGVGLGSFPFDCPTYLVQSDSRTSFMRHSEFDIPW